MITRVIRSLQLLNNRILLSLRKGGQRALVDALQLRHLRWTVRDPFDAEATPTRPQNNCFSRIINDDDSAGYHPWSRSRRHRA